MCFLGLTPGLPGLAFTPEKLNWWEEVDPNRDLDPSSLVLVLFVADGVPKENPVFWEEVVVAVDPKLKPVEAMEVLDVDPKLNPPEAEEDESVPAADPNLNPPPVPMVITAAAGLAASVSFLTSSS